MAPLHYLRREKREEKRKRRKFYIYPDVTHTHALMYIYICHIIAYLYLHAKCMYKYMCSLCLCPVFPPSSKSEEAILWLRLVLSLAEENPRGGEVWLQSARGHQERWYSRQLTARGGALLATKRLAIF